ncbi:rCG57463 [Rattus norvegicus]|uniref:RCG57463 n=1 Tax=Rattus norvegicus TaxID=10116 RepID=A6JHD1_RAT|nr:rCG57463 [Rattus norvegicus]
MHNALASVSSALGFQACVTIPYTSVLLLASLCKLPCRPPSTQDVRL